MLPLKKQLIKDSILSSIIFDDESLDLQLLINTREFKKLFNVAQLSFLNRYISSATISRYSHSLGAYEIARR